MLRDKGKNRICLSPLQPQPEPEQLRHLKREIGSRWPMTNLLDVLKNGIARGLYRSLQGTWKPRDPNAGDHTASYVALPLRPWHQHGVEAGSVRK